MLGRQHNRPTRPGHGAKSCADAHIRIEPEGEQRRKTPMPQSDAESIRRELFIGADPATVFAFLTDPDKLMRWMGTQCQLDAQPGGVYLVNVTGRDVARGAFEEVTPNSRIVYSFGWEHGAMGVPPGSTKVQIDLAPKERGTLLTFVHSGLPGPAIGPHTDGWTHYLGRLAIAAAGGDPGPDPRIKAEPC
jgi:uncharacterized protein YndB with AHSA1/START domain